MPFHFVPLAVATEPACFRGKAFPLGRSVAFWKEQRVLSALSQTPTALHLKETIPQ